MLDIKSEQKWPLIADAVESLQSRVISIFFWYLTSFVILAFAIYLSLFCTSITQSFHFSSENTPSILCFCKKWICRSLSDPCIRLVLYRLDTLTIRLNNHNLYDAYHRRVFQIQHRSVDWHLCLRGSRLICHWTFPPLHLQYTIILLLMQLAICKNITIFFCALRRNCWNWPTFSLQIRFSCDIINLWFW